ncbi:MAG: hypothetical protein GY779_15100 [Gammaproteobacteria bacterium]|nr:hypothetical protein [Gammaproteobacteria bacterium]
MATHPATYYTLAGPDQDSPNSYHPKSAKLQQIPQDFPKNNHSFGQVVISGDE